MSTKVLSVRISKELKDEIEHLGIDLRDTIEKALKESIEAKKKALIEELLKYLKEELSNITEDEWTRLIREMRESR
jgi:restriction endonuclease S subunit